MRNLWILLPIITILCTSCGTFTASVLNESNGIPQATTEEEKPVSEMIWSARAKLVQEESDESHGGFLEVHVYKDHTVKTGVRLNLPELEDGEYVVWLFQEEMMNAIRVGTLTPSENGGYYLQNATMDLPKNFAKYTTVLITKEKNAESTITPSEPLLKGTLKIVSGFLSE
ncbi:MAG TPA: hypothetical protein VJB60_03715 [Candidatus Peribacterales bacterium]|nr:hypothetical protein [Candidatus Peribacterales bacterium]